MRGTLKISHNLRHFLTFIDSTLIFSFKYDIFRVNQFSAFKIGSFDWSKGFPVANAYSDFPVCRHQKISHCAKIIGLALLFLLLFGFILKICANELNNFLNENIAKILIMVKFSTKFLKHV